jgi:hypothetical protein
MDDPTDAPVFERAEGSQERPHAPHLSVVEAHTREGAEEDGRGVFGWAMGGLAVAALAMLTVLGTTARESSKVGDRPAMVPPPMATPTTPAAPAAEPSVVVDTPNLEEAEAVQAEPARPTEGPRAAPDEGQEAEAEKSAGASSSRRRKALQRRPRSGTQGQAPAPRATSERNTSMTAVEAGRVQVVTPSGWASVFMGGRQLAPSTPALLTLPEGAHELSLRCFGAATQVRRTVNVRPGGTSRLVVPCTRDDGPATMDR